MTLVRATAVIDAPEGAVRRVLRRADVWTRTARAVGAQVDVAPDRDDPRAPLRSGDLVRIRPATQRRIDALLPPRSLVLRVDIEADGLPALSLFAGPLTRCTVTVRVAAGDGGPSVTVECDVDAPTPRASMAVRRRAVDAARILLGITLLAAREPLVVVAAALLRDGRVLAARRTRPPELAGRWELPGGKVRPGETETAALTRELAEELDISATVGDRVGGDVDLGDNAVLRCYRAELPTGADVRPVEHDVVRWLTADQLADVEWLAADSALVEPLQELLDGSGR